MSTKIGAAIRAGIVGAVTLALGALLPPAPAEAASAELEYACQYGVHGSVGDGTEGEGTATASFDTGIPDGLVVEVSELVSLDPFTGTIVLPDGLTQLLREQQLVSVGGNGQMVVGHQPSGYDVELSYTFSEVAVPATGTLSLDVEFRATSILAFPGSNRILADSFYLFLDGGVQAEGGANCAPVPGVLTTIDTFTGSTATRTTASAPARETPIRPVLVQTDFADEDRAMGAPGLVAAGFATLALALFGLARGRGRTASRRH